MNNNSFIYAPYRGKCLDDSFIGLGRAQQFIRNWGSWIECFSPETIEWLVNSRIKTSDACAISYVPCSADTSWRDKRYTRLPEIKRNFYFEERKGEWTRRHIEDAFQYLVPHESQRVHLRKFLYDGIYKDYPYMREYYFDAYVPSYGTKPEIYIEMHYEYSGEEVESSLYCPLSALKAKDTQIIYDRHYGYNSEYYKNKPELGKVLAILESEDYLSFCKQVRGD